MNGRHDFEIVARAPAGMDGDEALRHVRAAFKRLWRDWNIQIREAKATTDKDQMVGGKGNAKR